MGLPKQPIDIPLAAGIDTKVDPKLLKPGAMAAVENGRFLKDGSVQKIEGYDTVGSGVDGGGNTTQHIHSLLKYNDLPLFECLLANTFGATERFVPQVGRYDSFDSRLEADLNGADSIRPTAPLPYAKMERCGTPDESLDGVVAASVNGFTMRSWFGGFAGFDRRYVEVIRDSTGERVLLDRISNDRVQVCAVDSDPAVLVILYVNGADLCMNRFNTETGAYGVVANGVVTNMDVAWDAIGRPGADIVDVYYRSATTTFINHLGLDSEGNDVEPAAQVIAEGCQNDQPFSVCGTDSTVNRQVLCYRLLGGSLRPRYATFSVATTATLEYGPRDMLALATVPDRLAAAYVSNNPANELVLLAEYPAAGGVPRRVEYRIHTASTGAVAATASPMYHGGIAAKPFFYKKASYFWMFSSLTTQPALYLMAQPSGVGADPDKNRMRVVAFIAGGFAGRASSGTTTILGNSTQSDVDGEWVIGARYQARLESDGVILHGAALARVGFHSRCKRSLSIGTVLFRTGAVASVWDDSGYLPALPLATPEIESITNVGAGALSAGTYSYKLVVEVADYAGNIYRSLPSPPVSITLAAARQTAVLFFPPFFAGYEEVQRYVIHVYRTLANEPNYYKTGSIETFDGFTGPAALSAADNVSDAALEDNEILYTTGGILENVPPPCTSSAAISGDRVWLIPDDDPGRVWVSKPKLSGVALEFSDLLTLDASAGGPNTAIAAQDANVVLLKKDAIDALPAGQCPNAAGQGQFATPTRIASGVGCISPESVLTTRLGTMFQDVSGIWLLDRSLQLQKVGAAVEDFTDGVLVFKATAHPTFDEAWFLLENSRLLIFNLFYQRWSTYEPGETTSLQDLEFFENGRYFAAINSPDTGYLRRQIAGQYTENGTPVSLRVETPWLTLATLQELKRIGRAQLFAEWRSSHTLTMRVYVNWDETTPVQTVLLNANTGFTVGQALQLRAHMAVQKVESMKFSISDSTGAFGGEGYRPSILTLEAKMKRSGLKRPAAQSA